MAHFASFLKSAMLSVSDRQLEIALINAKTTALYSIIFI